MNLETLSCPKCAVSGLIGGGEIYIEKENNKTIVKPYSPLCADKNCALLYTIRLLATKEIKK